MTLQSSGTITFTNLVNEFGAPYPNVQYSVPWLKWEPQTPWVKASLGGGNATDLGYWTQFMIDYAVYPSNTETLTGVWHSAVWKFGNGSGEVDVNFNVTKEASCYNEANHIGIDGGNFNTTDLGIFTRTVNYGWSYEVIPDTNCGETDELIDSTNGLVDNRLRLDDSHPRSGGDYDDLMVEANKGKYYRSNGKIYFTVPDPYAGNPYNVGVLPADQYTLTAQCDNRMKVYWNNIYLGLTGINNDNPDVIGPATTFDINITTETEYYISCKVLNLDNGGGWSTNPGGAAWELKNSKGVVIRRSNDIFNYSIGSTGWGSFLSQYGVYPSRLDPLSDIWHETIYTFVTENPANYILACAADEEAKFYLNDVFKGSTRNSVTSDTISLGQLEGDTVYKLTTQVYNGANFTYPNSPQSATLDSTPTYSITPSRTTVTEGLEITFTVQTTNVAEGTELWWIPERVSGSGDFANDFDPPDPRGSGTIVTTTGNPTEGSFSFTLKIANDLDEEVDDTFHILLMTANSDEPGWTAEDIVARSDVITISDASLPTYTITSTPRSVSEGDTLFSEIRAGNTPIGTVLYWSIESISGTVTNDDFSFGSLLGQVTVNSSPNYLFTFSHGIASRDDVEGNVKFIFKLYTDSDRTNNVANTELIQIVRSYQPINDWNYNPGAVAFVVKHPPSNVGGGEIIKTSLQTGAQNRIGGEATDGWSLGNYRVSETYGELDDVRLDTDAGVNSDVDIPKEPEPISFSNFYNGKLNVILDYYSGDPEYRVNSDVESNTNARSRYSVTDKTRVVGGFKGRPTDPAGTKVVIVIGKEIGIESLDTATVGKYSGETTKCAFRTGTNWGAGTSMRIEVTDSGRIYGAGGNGGNGGLGGERSASSMGGSPGDSGTGALGVEHDGALINVRDGGKIIAGYGGGGGGGGSHESSGNRERCASGGGGGGGAGLPPGAGASAGPTACIYTCGGSAGSSGSKPNGGEEGGAGGGGCDQDNKGEAISGAGGRGGDQTLADQSTSSGNVGSTATGEGPNGAGGAGGSGGGAIRKSSGVSWTYGTEHVASNVYGEGKTDASESPTGVT